MRTRIHLFIELCLVFTLICCACAPLQPVTIIAQPSSVPSPTVAVLPTPTLTPFKLPPTATPEPVCTETTGSIEKGVIDTKLIDKPMRYNVYLPPCYHFYKDKRYPVLYLLHGQNSTEEQWIRIGAVSAADRIITSKDAPPFMIVFPYDYSYKQPSEYRFEEVFIQLLIPQIDTAFRSIADASQRAIGGLSRGGAWALRMGTRHPELFGAIGGHSPAIFYIDEVPLTRRVLGISPNQMPRIWLDVGDKDSEYKVIAPFEQFLSKNNIPHEWHEYSGWHDEKYWSAHVEEYLRWYALNWKQ